MERTLVERLLGEKLQATKKSILLLGPRQTGKSTLLSSLRPNLVCNLANESEFLRYSSDVYSFEAELTANKGSIILVDEIQRLPNLLNSIQAHIDKKSGTKFQLSGSSARKLRRGNANLLPGRILAYRLGGLCAKELGYNVDTDKGLRHGFLPEPYLESKFSESDKLLESYSAIYLREEIQAEALTRNLTGFARFLITLATHAGQIIDFSKLAKLAKISRTSCVRFIEILEDTLVAEKVTSFQEITNVDVVRHPKIFFFDPGVLNGLLQNFNVSNDRKGFLFEHLILSQIRNSAIAHDLPVEVYFFRTRHGLEVDFVIKLHGKIWAIEVKSYEASHTDAQSLHAFRSYYPKVHKCMLVQPMGRRREVDGVLFCDWLTMLQEMNL